MSRISYVRFLIIFFVIGCQSVVNNNSRGTVTQISKNDVTEMQVVPTSEPSPTMTPEIVFNKISIPRGLEAKLSSKCLDVTDAPPVSNSFIVLRSLKDYVPRQAPDIILIDMSEERPREIIQKINITSNFSVSPNRELIAYMASTFNDGEVTDVDLIIANGNFQIQNTFPWDDKWSSILGWTTDQKIIILLTPDAIPKPPVSYVLVDPLNGRQETIYLSIPDFLDKSLYDLPYWDGWFGLLINPNLEFAVYPRQSNANKEMHTYALWDISSNKTVLSLENIFSAFSSFNTFPKPYWTTDGTQFSFVSHKEDTSSLAKFELFLVSREGNIDQLTDLSDIAYVQPSFHSWSPDNSLIAFFLTPSGLNYANVAIVSTNNHDVVDLCLSINFQEPPPIWSPSGKQFLVVDKYEEGHKRVLLVDVEKNIVYLVANDAEPIGWMVKP